MDNAGPHYWRLEERGGGEGREGERIWRVEEFSSSRLNVWLQLVVGRGVGVGVGCLVVAGDEVVSLAVRLTGRRPHRDGTF